MRRVRRRFPATAKLPAIRSRPTAQFSSTEWRGVGAIVKALVQCRGAEAVGEMTLIVSKGAPGAHRWDPHRTIPFLGSAVSLEPSFAGAERNWLRK